jgi:hypothetical protein
LKECAESCKKCEASCREMAKAKAIGDHEGESAKTSR